MPWLKAGAAGFSGGANKVLLLLAWARGLVRKTSRHCLVRANKWRAIRQSLKMKKVLLINAINFRDVYVETMPNLTRRSGNVSEGLSLACVRVAGLDFGGVQKFLQACSLSARRNA